jgi:hypothetical protein
MWWNDTSIIIIQGTPLDASLSLCETHNIKNKSNIQMLLVNPNKTPALVLTHNAKKGS